MSPIDKKTCIQLKNDTYKTVMESHKQINSIFLIIFSLPFLGIVFCIEVKAFVA